MKTPRVIIASANDWQGLYVGGKLVTQGHSLAYDDVLRALNIRYDEVQCEKPTTKLTCCPQNAAELRPDK